jgi:hypothetical protein
MSRRADRGEASYCPPVERHVHAVENGASRREPGVPGPGAGDGIRIELPATAFHHVVHVGDVGAIVSECELVWRGMARLDVEQLGKELGIVAQRAGNRSQPPDMLGMPPAGVVKADVGVGDVGERQEVDYLTS